jgi:hypothetical protein
MKNEDGDLELHVAGDIPPPVVSPSSCLGGYHILARVQLLPLAGQASSMGNSGGEAMSPDPSLRPLDLASISPPVEKNQHFSRGSWDEDGSSLS